MTGEGWYSTVNLLGSVTKDEKSVLELLWYKKCTRLRREAQGLRKSQDCNPPDGGR